MGWGFYAYTKLELDLEIGRACPLLPSRANNRLYVGVQKWLSYQAELKKHHKEVKEAEKFRCKSVRRARLRGRKFVGHP